MVVTTFRRGGEGKTDLTFVSFVTYFESPHLPSATTTRARPIGQSSIVTSIVADQQLAKQKEKKVDDRNKSEGERGEEVTSRSAFLSGKLPLNIDTLSSHLATHRNWPEQAVCVCVWLGLSLSDKTRKEEKEKKAGEDNCGHRLLLLQLAYYYYY